MTDINRLTLRILRSGIDVGVTGVFSAWFILSVLAQHPDRAYDRVRSLDVGVGNAAIPNWRFFAPKPAVEDVHFLYRLANTDRSEHSEWRILHQISKRSALQALWAPDRRKEKGYFDIANQIMTISPDAGPELLEARRTAMELINDTVRRSTTPECGMEWFQVLMLRFAGNDPKSTPQYDVIFDYAHYESEID